MHYLRSDFAERDKNEFSILHLRVGEFEVPLFQLQVIEKKDVQINSSRPPPFPHFLAPHDPLDAFEFLEEQFGHAFRL
jgi:hypothetical protein